ncbi:hypothetical protein CGMCC3_g5057 [Colletotrichum fructicola]|nr:uncharacterized protein CGMCC3_g5057 [Colletotrichum fructicola]KAE9578725.1 hypothetical protein CGMCC3_g5057 [Colletotrichum fructicola]
MSEAAHGKSLVAQGTCQFLNFEPASRQQCPGLRNLLLYSEPYAFQGTWALVLNPGQTDQLAASANS